MFDIKAGNVLLDADKVTAKITDVGLSKMLAGSNTATLLVRPPRRDGHSFRPAYARRRLPGVCKDLHEVWMFDADAELRVHHTALSICCNSLTWEHDRQIRSDYLAKDKDSCEGPSACHCREALWHT